MVKQKQVLRLETQENEKINRNSPLTFYWQGKRYTGFLGDTLASALTANGVRTLARSYKYGRRRGLFAPWVEEPNAIVSLEENAYFTPNAKATQVELYDRLNAEPATGTPSLEFDSKILLKPFHKLFSAGFYYKTFMWPKRFWKLYERVISGLAGLSKSPIEPDIESYDHIYHNCDIAIVGGGIAGLQAASYLADKAVSVILIDDRAFLGGQSYLRNEHIESKKVNQWIREKQNEIVQATNIKIFTRTTALSIHDGNLLQAVELKQDHLPLEKRDVNQPRQSMHTIRVRYILLATGAQERHIAFHNNDLPGVMLSSTVSSLINEYAVIPGEQVVIFTNNNSTYNLVARMIQAEIDPVAVVDSREKNRIDEKYVKLLEDNNIQAFYGSAVIAANGSKHVTGVQIQSILFENKQWKLVGNDVKVIKCDILAVSGGFNPMINLGHQTGSRPLWDDVRLAFLSKDNDKIKIAGSADYYFNTDDCLADASNKTKDICVALGIEKALKLSKCSKHDFAVAPLFYVPSNLKYASNSKAFVDFQNDVKVSDIKQAIQENYQSIEHIKRYTVMGFGTDQGKVGNVVGIGIAAQMLQRPIEAIGTTTFRPPYSPISLGSLAGYKVKDLYEPKRYTPMHFSHQANGCDWECVGQWMRPWFFPKSKGEDMHAAVQRESLSARTSLAIMDASTLGKIDIQGPDAREFLNRVYTNAWSKLAAGKARYGLMLDENGMVIDDGVTTCLDENHFLMTTTTGGAARIYEWLERWLQTEWPELKVYITSVTDHWSTTALVGPKSREVMQELCQDIDFTKDAFKFMEYRQGTVCDVPARIIRISFSGELAYEINVQANYGRYIWDKCLDAGKKFNITKYGTETMHVLRAEKGYVIVGQDTDGTVTPVDLGMQWIIGKTKPFSFIGERSLQREDILRKDRKQLVGLLTQDPSIVLKEGAQLIQSLDSSMSEGHVTSSYFSSVLGRSIALALIKGGLSRKDEIIYARTAKDKEVVAAKITGSVFYDIEGERRDG